MERFVGVKAESRVRYVRTSLTTHVVPRRIPLALALALAGSNFFALGFSLFSFLFSLSKPVFMRLP